MVKPSSSSTRLSPSKNMQPNVEEMKYKGVRLRKWGKWVSEIRLPKSRERIWLGSFDTAKKAARAFDAALFCLRGPTAKFNFPDNPPNIVGAEFFTRDEIQDFASKFADKGDQGQLHSSSTKGEQEMELLTPEVEDKIDWSFLDVLDSTNIQDFSLYSGLSNISDYDMFFMPELLTPEDDSDVYGEDNSNSDDIVGLHNSDHHSFLWNF